jgi:hypothetical protein
LSITSEIVASRRLKRFLSGLSNSRVLAAAPHPAGSAEAVQTGRIYDNPDPQFKEKVSPPPDRHIEKGFGLWYHLAVERTPDPTMKPRRPLP